MTDFVLEQIKKLKSSEINILQFRNSIENYANFLKQPLELWMFVPCDEDGNVLEKPDYNPNENELENEWIEYQQAKERCLFEKSDYCEILLFELYDFVEDLTYAKVNLKLTQTAIKELES